MGIFDRFFKKKKQEKKNDKANIKRSREKRSLSGQEKDINAELVTELLSHNLEIRQKALIRARNLARAGDQSGQIALEEAIRIRSNLPNCEFYEPSFRVVSGEVIVSAEEEIYRLAKNNKLLEYPKKSQALIAKIFLTGTAVNVMYKVGAIGEEQLHDFQLLGTNLQCKSEQIRSSRRR